MHLCGPSTHSFPEHPHLIEVRQMSLPTGTALFDGDFSHPLLISPTHFPQPPKEANLFVQNVGIWGPADALAQTNGRSVVLQLHVMN
ncbi:hypothetical protein F2P79_005871 [Pimephales promelas]|nr:hypothetical protein F2P79_005871 [Pimephales promelas]